MAGIAHYQTLRYARRGTTGTEAIASATKASIEPEYSQARKNRPASHGLTQYAYADLVGGVIRVFVTDIRDALLHDQRRGTREKLTLNFGESSDAGLVPSQIAPTVMPVSFENITLDAREEKSGYQTGFALIFQLVGETQTQTGDQALAVSVGTP